MTYFDDLEFHRFNHMKDHQESIDAVFSTYALNYAHEGHIQFSQGSGPVFALKAPMAYWTWPGIRFRYHSADDQRWEHFYVSFRGERPERWNEAGLFPQGIIKPFIPITDPVPFYHAFVQLQDNLASGGMDNPLAVLQLEGLLLLMHRQPRRETAYHPRRREMLALVREIDEQPQKPVDLNRLARAMSLTPSHLRRLFNLFTGCPPRTYVNRARMLKAAELLRKTDKPIKEISRMVGLEDVYYFTRLFSKEHGLPPATYRHSYQLPEFNSQ